MMLFDREQHLERLHQKSLRYQHYQQNYEKRLETAITPNELKIKKTFAFQLVNDDFFIKWYKYYKMTKKPFQKLWLHEPFEVIAKIEIDFSNEIHKLNTEHCSAKCHELMDKNIYKKKSS